MVLYMFQPIHWKNEYLNQETNHRFDLLTPRHNGLCLMKKYASQAIPWGRIMWVNIWFSQLKTIKTQTLQIVKKRVKQKLFYHHYYLYYFKQVTVPCVHRIGNKTQQTSSFCKCVFIIQGVPDNVPNLIGISEIY